MYIQDLFVRYYDWRPFNSTLLNKITGNSSKKGKYFANRLLPFWFKRHISCHIKIPENNIVVCVTSFPERIDKLWLVLECMLRQTILPSKIVVYLSKEQFESVESIPNSIRRYVPLVDIRLVDNNIKSHKKYWYAVEEFLEQNVVLIDDDIIYDSRLIERLVNGQKKNPHCVIANYGHIMQWDKNGNLSPYLEWSHRRRLVNTRQNDFFFGSGGGTLFPPHSLRGANIMLDKLMEICPTADDVWLNAIIRVNGWGIVPVRAYNSCPTWENKNNVQLKSINVDNSQNDVQIQKVREFCLSQYKKDLFLPM